MPLYNAARTVAASLESVLAQTYTKLEILVVDDGSTDEGVAICRSYGDSRIQIVPQQNRGLAGARNTGIRHSSGAILAFLDSDDLWLPEKIERHVQHLEANPSVGVSYSRSAFIDDQGQPLGIYQMPQLNAITPELIFCRNPIGNGSAVVIRREVLEAIRFQANLYGELMVANVDDNRIVGLDPITKGCSWMVQELRRYLGVTNQVHAFDEVVNPYRRTEAVKADREERR